MARYTVAVAGATGYAGGEALRILAAHPDFEVTCVAGHSSVGQKLGRHMPHIPQLADLTVATGETWIGDLPTGELRSLLALRKED